MDIEAVIQHFGGVKNLAQALDVYPQNIYHWREKGIPLLRQYQIQVLTDDLFSVTDAKEAPK